MMNQFDILTIHINEDKVWDPSVKRYVHVPDTTLELKHSLLSIRMWESKWKIPFLHHGEKSPERPNMDGKPMTEEQMIDYVICMTLNKRVDPIVYTQITTAQMIQIISYMNDSKTASWVNHSEEDKKKSSESFITAERIYSWMRKLGIPFECEKWHFSQLMMLIDISSEDDKPQEEKKIDADFYKSRAKRNEEKKAAWYKRMAEQKVKGKL